MILREIMLVFRTFEGALAFHNWARSYFAGALDGSCAILMPQCRVYLKGLYAGEAAMFAREAEKLGGFIELQQQEQLHLQQQQGAVKHAQ